MKSWRTEYPGAEIERNMAGMDADDIEQARRLFAALLAAVEAGELEASPGVAVGMVGALETLESTQ